MTVQGERCAPEVAAAIRGFNAIRPGGPVPRPDLIIVARGGGSLEDLWGFNEEIVVRAVAEGTIPLISAVGHETDTTLIDFVADRRAPTPTAAAEMAVPVRVDLVAALAGLEHRRRNALARTLAQLRLRLRDLARGLPRPEALLAERAQRLDGLGVRLPLALIALHPADAPGAQPRGGRAVRAAAARGRGGRAAAAADPRRARAAARGARRGIERLRERLEARDGRLARVAGGARWSSRARVGALARTLETLAPHRVLERGFAIVRDEAGEVLTARRPGARSGGARDRVRRRPGAGAAGAAAPARRGAGTGAGDAALRLAADARPGQGKGRVAPAELEDEARPCPALDELGGEAAGAVFEAPALGVAALLVAEADAACLGATRRRRRRCHRRTATGCGGREYCSAPKGAPAGEARRTWPSGTGASSEVESHGSWPAMTFSTAAASSTVRANGPIWSSDEAKAIRP